MKAKPKARIKRDSKDSKKTTLRTKNNKTVKKRSKKSKYEITKDIDLKRLTDPTAYPYKNVNKLQRKFLKEYRGFFDFFRKSQGFLKPEIFKELLLSWDFRNFAKDIAVMQRSWDKSKTQEGTTEQQNQALRIMTSYQQLAVWYESLLDDLPKTASDSIRQLLEPQLKQVKGIIEIIKDTNPELKNIQLYDSNLEFPDRSTLPSHQ